MLHPIAALSGLDEHMATGAPTSHTDSATDHGYAAVFASADLDLAIMDQLDALQLGIVQARGSFAGQGSNVLNVEYIDDVGAANPMAALTGETDAVPLSTPTSGYTQITLGNYGVAYGQTYTSQMLNRQPGIDLDSLASLASFAGSYVARVRALVCAAGAGISATVGSVATTASVDDYIDLHVRNIGFSSTMRPCRQIVMRPTAFGQLMESARTEPGFQGDAASFAAGLANGIGQGQYVTNYLGLGYDFALTADVTSSGGGYNSFAVSEGGIAYAPGDTSRIKVPPHVNPVAIPQWGLLFQDVYDDLGQATLKREARAWIGVAIGSTLVFRQTRWLSIAS